MPLGLPRLMGQFTHLNSVFIGMACIHFCHVDALFFFFALAGAKALEALRCRKQIDRNLKELLRVQQLHGLFGQYQKQGWREWTGETREESGHDQKTVSSFQPYRAVCFLVTS